jgi:hypothetical protein
MTRIHAGLDLLLDTLSLDLEAVKHLADIGHFEQRPTSAQLEGHLDLVLSQPDLNRLFHARRTSVGRGKHRRCSRGRQ